MTPQLNPLVPSGPVAVPPPLRFRPPVGTIRNVRMSLDVQMEQRGNTSAKHAGVLYERKAHDHLERTLGSKYLRSPFLHWLDDSGARTCIPDGLVLFPDRSVIIEIKSQHMPEAWWQLRRLYEPVVRALYPDAPCQSIEVARWYDPATPFPTSVELIDDLPSFIQRRPLPGFGVYVWRP